uniref:Uncharacterized protein n=1 Tax=Panagrolaimus sp. ES5 TaxID=591445 RepID=A0AC34EZH0_9BILA
MATAEISPEASSSAPAVMFPSTDSMLFQSPSTSSEDNSNLMVTPKKIEPFIPRRSETISLSSSTEPPKIGQKRSLSQAEFKNLPRFTANVPEGSSLPAPSARIPSSPSPKNDIAKRISRPNSPSNVGRIVLPRSRIANIRRESDCSLESEVAHERYIKTAVQVSVGFEDFSLDDKSEDRKRAKSFTDPISITILGSCFPTSSNSPTRANVDQAKQCYSPATQQLVRPNISYSPSPSPTPSSPKRSRVMRSMSPIVTRQISKRRYTNNSGNCSGNSDTEGPPLSSKRQCTSFSKSCGSPLIREVPTFYNPNAPPSNGSDTSFNNEATVTQRTSSPTPSESSTTSSVTSFFKPRSYSDQLLNTSTATIGDSDESSFVNDDQEVQYTQKDDQSSTTFSSRACTPIDEGDSRLPDEAPVQCTTPTGLVRTFTHTAGSSSPFRFTLPPSPLASQRLRDASDF